MGWMPPSTQTIRQGAAPGDFHVTRGRLESRSPEDSGAAAVSRLRCYGSRITLSA